MKQSNKGAVAIIIAMFFTIFTVNAQTHFSRVGGYLVDSQTGGYSDMSTREIGSRPTSNPSTNPYKAQYDAYVQAQTYNTPSDWYIRGFDYHQQQQQPVYQQPVVQQPVVQPNQPAVSISITCYFFTPNKEKLIAIGGSYNNQTRIFTPGLANYWTGSTWSGYKLGKSPLAELSFCGAFLPDANNTDVWVSATDQKWANDKWFAFSYDGYASRAPIQNGVVSIL